MSDEREMIIRGFAADEELAALKKRLLEWAARIDELCPDRYAGHCIEDTENENEHHRIARQMREAAK
jgi:hypothetical protein